MTGGTIVGAVDGMLLATRSLNADADPYAAYLVYDTFTDDDAVTLPNHTPEKDTEAGGWQAFNGTFDVTSNRSYLDTAGGGQEVAAIDVGTAEHTVECKFHFQDSATADGGMVCRGSDNDNYWMLATVAGQVWYLYKHETGGFSQEASGGTSAKDTTYTLKIVCDGDDITCYVDDGEVCSVTDTFNNDATYCGSRIHSANDGTDGSYHDDLTVIVT